MLGGLLLVALYPSPRIRRFRRRLGPDLSVVPAQGDASAFFLSHPATLCLALHHLYATGFFASAGEPRKLVSVPAVLSPPAAIGHLSERLASINDQLTGAYDQGIPCGALGVEVGIILLVALTIFGATVVPPRIPIVLLGVASAVIYVFVPENLPPHGGFLLCRLAFLPPLLWMAVAAGAVGETLRRVLATMLFGLILTNLGLFSHYAWTANRDISEYAAAIDLAGHGQTIRAHNRQSAQPDWSIIWTTLWTTIA